MIALIFSHYRLPETRLQEHFQWNSAIYLQSQVRVFVASDRHYDLPPYAECVICPPMDMFSLTRTSNAVKAKALECGATTIIKTDVDIAFSDGAFQAMAQVPENVCRIARVVFTGNFAERHKDTRDTPAAMGTVAMVRGDWQRLNYDERLQGWGMDDVLLVEDAKRIGIAVQHTDDVVWHIAHAKNTDFNPNRNKYNYRYLEERKRLA